MTRAGLCLVVVKIKGKFTISITVGLLVAVAGLVFGTGTYTFVYGEGYSYFSDDPRACVNCHVMRDHYESWVKNPHGRVTTCNSCHAPEEIYLKYFVKAENGFNHSWKFTTGLYTEPIQIREHNFKITMKACLSCHGELFQDPGKHAEIEGRSCVSCHQNVGHDH